MDTPVHELELQILQLLALIIGALVIIALRRVAEFVGVKLDAHKLDMLNSVVDKAMSFAVTQADATIREKGWDHVDSKNRVIDFALQGMEDKFSDTLKANNVDLTNPGDRALLMQMMERMWPDVATRLSASPATPDGTAKPVVAAVNP